MKVNQLLDNIFFGNGNKDYLPIAKKFAGNDQAEIFGIYENYMDDTVRVLVTMPKSAEANSKLNMFLANNTGAFSQVGDGAYTRDDVLAVYSVIMADEKLFKMVTDTNIAKASNSLNNFIKEAQKETEKTAAQKQ